MSEIIVKDMGKNNTMLLVTIPGASGVLIPKSLTVQEDYISDAKKIIDIMSGEGHRKVFEMGCNPIGLQCLIFFCLFLNDLGYNGESHKDNFEEVKEKIITLLANPLPIL